MKKFPHVLDVEAKVLGGLILIPDAWNMVSDIFHSELFYDDKHRLISKALIELKAEGVKTDLLTIQTRLKKHDTLHIVGGLGYLMKLTNVVTTGNIDYEIKILQEYYAKRKIIFECSKLTDSAFSETTDIFELIGDLSKTTNELENNLFSQTEKTSAELAIEVFKRNKTLLANNRMIGLNTGFEALNKITGGWQNSDFILLAARPGMGKTSMALQFLSAPTLSGIPTGIISMEMSAMQIYMRMMSHFSELDLSKFLRQGLSPDEESYVQERCKHLFNAEIYFNEEGGLNVAQVKNIARKLKRTKGIKLLVIDYLQLISSGTKTFSRENEIGYVSRSLKALAKELDIPIIALSQLSRESEKRSDKRPMLSDLRDSGALEQDADMVLFIYRPEYYGIIKDDIGNSLQGAAFLQVEKHRNGNTGEIHLQWRGDLTKFYDKNHQHELTPDF